MRYNYPDRFRYEEGLIMHLYEALTERVSHWRSEHYPCEQYPVIAEINEVGEFDVNEIGEGEAIIFIYSPDAEK